MALKGMESSPLAHILLQRHMGMGAKLPSMKGPHMPSMARSMSQLGQMKMQPKVKPMASGFRMPSIMPKF